MNNRITFNGKFLADGLVANLLTSGGTGGHVGSFLLSGKEPDVQGLIEQGLKGLESDASGIGHIYLPAEANKFFLAGEAKHTTNSDDYINALHRDVMQQYISGGAVEPSNRTVQSVKVCYANKIGVAEDDDFSGDARGWILKNPEGAVVFALQASQLPAGMDIPRSVPAFARHLALDSATAPLGQLPQYLIEDMSISAEVQGNPELMQAILSGVNYTRNQIRTQAKASWDYSAQFGVVFNNS